MAIEIGALRASLSASSAQFASDMGKARQALQTNAAKMRRAMDRVGSAFKSTLGHLKRYSGFAIAGGVAGFVALIKKSIDTADELGKLSQSVGISVEALSTLAHAAELSGVELPALSSGLKLLSKNALDTGNNVGEARDAFRALQIDVKTSNGVIKDADVLLLEIADKFAGLKDGATKTALAMRFFGKSGAALIPLLNAGAVTIQEMQDRARELGLELDMKTALAAAAFNDRITDLKANVTGFGRRIVADAIPALNQMVGAMAEAYKHTGLLRAIWEGIRAPGELKRAQEEFDRLKTIQEELVSAGFLKKAESWWKYYHKGGLQAAVAEASTQKAIAEFHERKRIAAARAAGDKRREEEEAAAAASRELAAVMEQQNEEEKIQKEKEANEKIAARRAAAEAQRVADAARARVKQGEDAINQLQREQDLFDTKTRAETVAWEIEQGNLSELSSAHQEKILNLAQELDILDALKIAQDKRADAEQKAQQKATQLMTKHMTQQERYNETVQELNELFATGKLKVEVYERELENLANLFQTDLTQAIEGWGQRSTDVLTDFVMTAKISIRDLINSVIRDLVRLQIQQQLTQPLFALIQSTLGPVPSPVPSPAPKPVPGRATGGPVAAGGFYEITEKGPEVLAMGNRQFLMMSQQGGEVTPIESGLLPGRAKGGKVRPEEIVEINERDPEVLAMGNRQFLMMSQQGGEITPVEDGLIRAGKRMAIQEQEDEITPIEGGLVRAGKRMAIQERGSEILARGNRQFLERVQQDRPENQTASLRETPETDVSSITPQSVRIINVLDPEVVTNWASSPSGERVVMNIISRHASQLKQLLN